MPKYWMISDRDGGGDGDERNLGGPRYLISDGDRDLHNIDNWNRVSFPQFRKAITDACDKFPDLPPDQHDEEKEVEDDAVHAQRPVTKCSKPRTTSTASPRASTNRTEVPRSIVPMRVRAVPVAFARPSASRSNGSEALTTSSS